MNSRTVLFGLLLVVAAAAAVLSFAALRDLALLCGFSRNLTWLLPVVVDAGAAAGSLVWLGNQAAGDAQRFARTLALALLGLSVVANALGHGLAAFHLAPPWWVVVAVSAIAPAVLGAVVHLAVLVGRLDPEAGDTLPAGDPAGEDVPAAREMGPVELVERARVVVTTAERPVGRRRLARELDVTEHQARQLLAKVTDPAGEHPAETHTPAQLRLGEETSRNGAPQHV